MNKIQTIIYVEPTPKGRARSRIAGGGAHQFVHHYTPAKTRDAEAMIKAMIRREVMGLGEFAADIPLRIEAIFYRERPKSLPRRVTMPVSRPDLDNYWKLLTDALEKYVYKNDSQICTVVAKKRFGSPPRIELIIEVDPGD